MIALLEPLDSQGRSLQSRVGYYQAETRTNGDPKKHPPHFLPLGPVQVDDLPCILCVRGPFKARSISTDSPDRLDLIKKMPHRFKVVGYI